MAVFAPLAHDTTIQLDECNGRTTEKDGYHYYAQAPELNQVVKCYMGLLAVDTTSQQQGPPGGGPGPGQGQIGFPIEAVIGAGALVVVVGASGVLFIRRRKAHRG